MSNHNHNKQKQNNDFNQNIWNKKPEHIKIFSLSLHNTLFISRLDTGLGLERV